MHHMNAPLPAPEDAGEPDDEGFFPEVILDYVRAEAARRDPGLARVYRAATPRRVRNAGWLAHALMAAHLELHRRVGRGARTGRRKHAQEVYRLLNASNDA